LLNWFPKRKKKIKKKKKYIKKEEKKKNEENFMKNISDFEEKFVEQVAKIFDEIKFDKTEINIPKEIPTYVKDCFDEGMKIVEDGIVKGYCIFNDLINETDLNSFDYEECFKNIGNALKENLTIFDSDVKETEIDEPELVIHIDNFKPVVEEKQNDVPVFADSYVYEKVKMDIKNDNLSDSLIDLRLKYVDQLNELKGMGFLVDDEVLALILEQSNGNISDAVLLLLQNSVNK